MIPFADKKGQKGTENYRCEKCDYTTCHIGHWKRHLKTKKHNDTIMIPYDTISGQKGTKKDSTVIVDTNLELNEWKCNCGKEYSRRQNLYRHRKKCIIYINGETQMSNIEEDDELIEQLKEANATLMSQNGRLINQLVKVNDKLIDKATGSNTTGSHNNNSFNNTFNIQMFLTERCQNAMSIQDFAQQLMITMEDLAKTNKDRPAGICEIITKHLSPLEITERPVHRTNNDEWYIKDKEEGWGEDKNNKLISETQKSIQRKANHAFEQEHPNWQNVDTLGEKYVETIGTAMSDLSDKDVKKIKEAVGVKVTINNK